MRYCKKCLYPENAKPTIIFDDEGICSGCRYHESRMKLDIDWDERWSILKEICQEAKDLAKERGNSHDCIIPVSGGKDSHYQVWLMKEKLGMNPLLVHFNHGFNSPAGQRNFRNLKEQSGCDIIEYHAGMDAVKKISRYMLNTVGDITWHYHAGLRTVPFQVAVEKNIPLIIWGEHGFAELTGIVSMEDFVEFTRWSRKEHDMRGFEPEDLIGKGGITNADIAPYVYPSDESIEKTEVRGIYLSNFIYWDAKRQTEVVSEHWDFGPVTYKRGRTFNLHAKIEDHANEVHDYLKYLKFGYGRGTDDASMEIRHGRMTREEGMRVVEEYDSTEPENLHYYCDFVGISVEEFYQLVDEMRDPEMWKKNESGEWVAKDSAWQNEVSIKNNDYCKFDLKDHVYSKENRHLFYNPMNPPEKSGEDSRDLVPDEFVTI